MRRHNNEIFDNAEIDRVITKAQICRLGLCIKGNMYIVPMFFGYRDQTFFFHCALDEKNLLMLRENPRVWIEVEGEIAVTPGSVDAAFLWSANYECIMGEGRTFFLNSPAEKAAALSIIMEKYSGPGQYAFREDLLEAIVVFRVDPVFLRGKRSPSPSFRCEGPARTPGASGNS